ncbi:MAG TPA: branched-chain amino acid ABC transporter substrate-binding protein [Acetobacteraceae bacterium]|nr:branched-chain amino acid ABC transporter substrate-binding protein [Acetobacteraceae bacterium]
MIKGWRGFVLALAMAGLAMLPMGKGVRGEVAAGKAMKLGYVELADDPRYADRGSLSGINFTDLGRPYLGSQVALADAQAIGRVVRVDFSMEKATGKSVDDLVRQISGWITAGGVHFVLADLPAAALKELSHRLAGQPVMLFNISAPDDSLRAEDCAANVLHTYPSQAMLADALLQYLATKEWGQILVLQGPAPEDAARVAALERSAKKFRAKIVDVRRFLLTSDPRNRAQTNIVLMTNGARYDVVYVADASRELARYVPYQTALPRPVVGSAGLMPTAWSWAWDRDAAVQLQHRFEKLAPPRRMNAADWAAWEAVKAVTQAVVRTQSTSFDAVKAFLLSDKLNLDTVKGNPGSFRPWDHQLRAPVLLSTADAVIDRAPLPEFLHQTNVLDTLGIDAPETKCHL